MSNKPLHVAFGVDKNFMHAMGILIMSMVENNPDIDFRFHCYTLSILDEDRKRLTELENRYNIKVDMNVLDDTLLREFGEFSPDSPYTMATFVRLIIPALLRNKTDKYLHLDADMVCIGKLDALPDMNLDGYIAAVVSDAPIPVQQRTSALRIKSGKYFNAGFMYVNTVEWVDQNIKDRAVEQMMVNGSKYRFNDQDVLNIVIGDKVKYIDRKYNFLYNLESEIVSGRVIDPDTAIIHYAGVLKPWYNWCLNDNKSYFLKYHFKSPWKGVSLNDPRKPREMRLYSACLRRTGRKWEGFKMYLKYLKMKLIR